MRWQTQLGMWMLVVAMGLCCPAAVDEDCPDPGGVQLDGVFFLVTEDLLDSDMTTGLYGYPTLGGVPMSEHAFILGVHVYPDQLLGVERFQTGEQWEVLPGQARIVELPQKWVPPGGSPGVLGFTVWFVFFEEPVTADGVVLHYELPRPVVIDGDPTGEYRTTGTVSFGIACADLCLSCVDMDFAGADLGDPAVVQSILEDLAVRLQAGECDSFLLPFVPIDPPGEGHVGFM